MLEALGFGNVQAAVFTLPLVKRGLADAILAANVDYGLALALLAQDVDDLRFAKITFFHKAVGQN